MCEFCDMLRNKVVELEDENTHLKMELEIRDEQIKKLKDERIRLNPTFWYGGVNEKSDTTGYVKIGRYESKQ